MESFCWVRTKCCWGWINSDVWCRGEPDRHMCTHDIQLFESRKSTDSITCEFELVRHKYSAFTWAYSCFMRAAVLPLFCSRFKDYTELFLLLNFSLFDTHVCHILGINRSRLLRAYISSLSYRWGDLEFNKDFVLHSKHIILICVKW